MKKYLIKKYFSQAYARLQGVGCVTSVDEPVFDRIMDELDCYVDEGDIDTLIKRFDNQLGAIQEWVGNIYPKDPNYEDKQVLKRFGKAVDYCIDKLGKVRKLIE